MMALQFGPIEPFSAGFVAVSPAVNEQDAAIFAIRQSLDQAEPP
jgi:hypothetical protein